VKRKKLGKEFFNQPTLRVSRALLGKAIVRVYRGRKILGIVNEVEAYIGPDDRAAHSYLHPDRAPQKWQAKFALHGALNAHAKGRSREVFERWALKRAKITMRNIAEYLESGHIYIYMVYGLHWQLNFSTGGEGIPECVLIRSVIPVKELRGGGYVVDEKNTKKANGPGKLCAYLKLDGSFYAEDATRSKRVWLEDAGITLPPGAIGKTPRIGIDYAGEKWAGKPWRFLVTTGTVFP